MQELVTKLAPEPEATNLMPGWRQRLSHVAARRLPMPSRCVQVTRPFVSFTFDDFPQSAARIGAALLEEAGARGTFYAATGLIGRSHDLWHMATREDVAALDASGHEIGWHTHEHLLAWQYGSSGLKHEYARSVADLSEMACDASFETFAYPFGIGCYWRKRQLATMLRGARSVQPGINRGWIDPGFLKAVDLSASAIDGPRVSVLIDMAIRQTGWLIFFTHDVADHPTRYGTTPRLLASTIEAVKKARLPITPVCEVLDHLGVPWIGTKDRYRLL